MSDRIVLIGMPMLLRGGTEIQTLSLVNALRREGWKVVVCCYYEHEAGIEEEFRSAGATLRLLDLRRSSGSGSLPELWRLLRSLVPLFRSVRPDIVHVQYVAPGLVPIVAARSAGLKRIFVTIHYPCHGFGRKEKAFVWLAARLSSLFICNSLATERSWFGSAREFDGSITGRHSQHCTVYNSIDRTAIETAAGPSTKETLRASLGISQARVVGIVARLRWEKGHHVLFRAMAAVVRRMPETALVVVGDGPDRQFLEALAAELGIENSIVWLGARRREETLRLYGAMDLVAVPSEFEGFGLSAAEAMAAGLPVVASDVGGLTEVVDNGVTGLLVRYGDVNALALAIISLLGAPKKMEEMGQAGRRRVEELFSRLKFEETMASVYEKA